MKELSINGKLWLFAAACGLIAGYVCYNFYFTELITFQQETTRLDEESQVKKAQLNQILAQKQRLKDLESEIDRANKEFAKLQEMFPDEEIIPKRLIDLTAVTRKSLTLPTRFLPLKVEEKEFYKENHYAITISSSYHSLGMLFGEVANFKYPTSIRKVTIDQVKDLKHELDISRDHGEIPRTVIASFELTTFTAKK